MIDTAPDSALPRYATSPPTTLVSTVTYAHDTRCTRGLTVCCGCSRAISPSRSSSSLRPDLQRPRTRHRRTPHSVRTGRLLNLLQRRIFYPGTRRHVGRHQPTQLAGRPCALESFHRPRLRTREIRNKMSAARSKRERRFVDTHVCTLHVTCVTCAWA